MDVVFTYAEDGYAISFEDLNANYVSKDGIVHIELTFSAEQLYHYRASTPWEYRLQWIRIEDMNGNSIYYLNTSGYSYVAREWREYRELDVVRADMSYLNFIYVTDTEAPILKNIELNAEVTHMGEQLEGNLIFYDPSGVSKTIVVLSTDEKDYPAIIIQVGDKENVYRPDENGIVHIPFRLDLQQWLFGQSIQEYKIWQVFAVDGPPCRNSKVLYNVNSPHTAALGTTGEEMEPFSIFLDPSHTHDFQYEKVEATHTNMGWEGYCCKICGYPREDVNYYEALGHEFEWTTIKEATLEHPEQQKGICSCGAVRYRDYGEALCVNGHTSQTLMSHAATCTQTGISEGAVCAVCGTVLIEQEEIPKTPHTIVIDTAIAPTKSSEGKTEGSHCSVCGTILKAQETIPKLSLSDAETGKSNTDTVHNSPLLNSEGTQEIAKPSDTVQPSILLEKARLRLNVTGTLPIKIKQSTAKVVVTDIAADDRVISWSSSNTKIASVTPSGKITGKKVGTAEITVKTERGASATFKIRVQKSEVKATSIKTKKSSIQLKKGKSFDLQASVTPLTVKDKISYKTSNKKVATVSRKGVIKAKRKGKAVITIRCGKKTKKVKINVK